MYFKIKVADGCQGGFARVYEVETREGERKAVKVVNKDSIRSKKNKTKVSCWDLIRRMLRGYES